MSAIIMIAHDQSISQVFPSLNTPGLKTSLTAILSPSVTTPLASMDTFFVMNHLVFSLLADNPNFKKS